MSEHRSGVRKDLSVLHEKKEKTITTKTSTQPSPECRDAACSAPLSLSPPAAWLFAAATPLHCFVPYSVVPGSLVSLPPPLFSELSMFCGTADAFVLYTRIRHTTTRILFERSQLLRGGDSSIAIASFSCSVRAIARTMGDHDRACSDQIRSVYIVCI